ncbi:type II toxin-antitoxin system death-on-curing family toxin [Ahrensia marina]|uniref:type II toxin-antitoxin system death-on-curing family toxin n=1 Tax=Ahrensia marina TaxID=1514904 RepID=UPI0009EC81B2|nr:type II toxin-antitoxin system death-on-curing family toxin [Ahrensia marina]
MKRDYLTREDVLEIHSEQIERYGGADGLRDSNQLDSAIARPQSGYYSDIQQEAAALWESLSQNHVFVDGNKRTAFSSTYRFLALNDVTITADADEVWEFLNDAYETGNVRYNVLVDWLSGNTQDFRQEAPQTKKLELDIDEIRREAEEHLQKQSIAQHKGYDHGEDI